MCNARCSKFLLTVALVVLFGLTSHASVIEISLSGGSLREALIEAGRQAGVDILLGDEVAGSISGQLKANTIESALEQLLSGTPFTYVHQGSFYIIGAAHPSSRLFQMLAVTQVYQLRYLRPEQAASELAGLGAYVGYTPSKSMITVTAPPDMQKLVQALITKLDVPESLAVVNYRLHVVELSESQVARFGLGTLEWNAALIQNALQIIVAPTLLQLLSNTTEVLGLQAAIENNVSEQHTEPTLTTILGTPVKMKVLEEHYSINEKTQQFEVGNVGFELTITPLRIGYNKEQVLSRLQFKRVGTEGGIIGSEVWVPSDAYMPVALARQSTIADQHSMTAQEKKIEDRYFALYLTAQPGILSASPDVLRFPTADLEPFVSGAAVRPSTTPSNVRGSHVEWQLMWRTSSHLSMQNQRQASLYSEALIEQRLFANGILNLGGHLTLAADDQSIALGLSGRTRVTPSAIMSAGIYPYIFQSDMRQTSSTFWWVDSEISNDNISVDLHVASDGVKPSVRLALGYSLNATDKVFIGYRYNGSDSNNLVLGLQLTLDQ